MLDQAGLASPMRVLDLACGTGTLAIDAKLRAPLVDVTGMNGDPVVLERAIAKSLRAGTEIQFDRGLSHELPYADASFDRVLSSLFFHHLTSHAKRDAFSEVARVLKPGGELHVADWGAAQNGLMRLAFYGIQLLDGFSNTADYVAGRLPGFMIEAGLADVQERKRFSTMLGTISLYCASKAGVPLSLRRNELQPCA